MTTNNKHSGPLDVNGDINPITHESIEKVDANDWTTMSAGELQHQKSVLQTRLNIAAQYSPKLIPLIKRGIAQIDQIIASKNSDTDTGLM